MRNFVAKLVLYVNERKNMTRDIINVQYPTLEHTESVANICIEKTTVVPANGITIEEAFSNKNNSLFVVIEKILYLQFFEFPVPSLYILESHDKVTLPLCFENDNHNTNNLRLTIRLS